MIRPAEPADVPAIHALILGLAAYERGLDEVSATEDDLRAALFGRPCGGRPDARAPASTAAERPSLFGHVAEQDGEIVGFALWFINYSTWAGRHGIYLEDLYVKPERRSRGHGRALLAELARICVERGYARLEWWVLDWNTPAQGFYSSLGARPMDEWTVHRLTGPALRDLAGSAGRQGGPGDPGGGL